MKPLYKAATNMLDVVDGKASFLLSYVDTPPAISGAVFTSVCISVETKICTGLDDGPGAYWSHFLKAKTFKDRSRFLVLIHYTIQLPYRWVISDPNVIIK